MLRAVLLAGLAVYGVPAMADDALAALVANDPIAEAEKAFARGDHRHIVLPVCGKERGEVIPGWPLQDSPRVQDAMKLAHRPISCADLGDDPKQQRFMRVATYAERYNRKMLELEDGKEKR